eukprot:jgi/Botrbrau1/4284/Bobra.0390s0024.1
MAQHEGCVTTCKLVISSLSLILVGYTVQLRCEDKLRSTTQEVGWTWLHYLLGPNLMLACTWSVICEMGWIKGFPVHTLLALHSCGDGGGANHEDLALWKCTSASWDAP